MPANSNKESDLIITLKEVADILRVSSRLANHSFLISSHLNLPQENLKNIRLEDKWS